MRIKSITPLSDSELRRITAIFEESNCPHESLLSTFPEAYYRSEGETIYFGRHSYDYTYEICPVIKVDKN